MTNPISRAPRAAVENRLPLIETMLEKCRDDPAVVRGLAVAKTALKELASRTAWQPIETMPTGEELILAWVPPDGGFPDGRMMIWKASILARQFEPGQRTPNHLQYPATRWMLLPAPPPAGEG